MSYEAPRAVLSENVEPAMEKGRLATRIAPPWEPVMVLFTKMESVTERPEPTSGIESLSEMLTVPSSACALRNVERVMVTVWIP